MRFERWIFIDQTVGTRLLLLCWVLNFKVMPPVESWKNRESFYVYILICQNFSFCTKNMFTQLMALVGSSCSHTFYTGTRTYILFVLVFYTLCGASALFYELQIKNCDADVQDGTFVFTIRFVKPVYDLPFLVKNRISNASVICMTSSFGT